jgi:hypothetical protein
MGLSLPGESEGRRVFWFAAGGLLSRGEQVSVPPLVRASAGGWQAIASSRAT